MRFLFAFLSLSSSYFVEWIPNAASTTPPPPPPDHPHGEWPWQL